MGFPATVGWVTNSKTLFLCSRLEHTGENRSRLPVAGEGAPTQGKQQPREGWVPGLELDLPV